MRVRLTVTICGPMGTFQPGEVVASDLFSAETLAHLLASGYAETVGEVGETHVKQAPEVAAMRVGRSSWYELPDGRRVRGKAAARAAINGG